MKILNFNNEQFKAEKIIKTDADIIGYDSNGIELFAFRVVSDFSLFSLEDGEEFDTVEPTKEELLTAQIVKDGVAMKLQIATLTAQIAKLTGGIK